MKNTIKIIYIILGLSLLGGIVYATITTARTSGVNKLPYNGAGGIYDQSHNRGPANAGDVARFTGTLGAGNIITDTRTGLMWQSVPLTTIYTWDNAKTYCANLSLGGYTDWRMPNIQELMSIVDYSYSSSNYWYETKFTIEANYYWSSTTNAANTIRARYLHFPSASTGDDGKMFTKCVICTR